MPLAPKFVAAVALDRDRRVDFDGHEAHLRVEVRGRLTSRAHLIKDFQYFGNSGGNHGRCVG